MAPVSVAQRLTALQAAGAAADCAALHLAEETMPTKVQGSPSFMLVRMVLTVLAVLLAVMAATGSRFQ